ncbi:MAG: hypothetical protein JNK93_11260 [Planctomycetia bacterium]|nr:hypothetical protein [Planctomycetia bacterium]
MALETMIDFPCRPKRDLGGGDLRGGTESLIDLLAVQRRVQQVRSSTRPDQLTVDLDVRVMRMVDGDTVERVSTLGRLELELTALEPHVPICTNCPANATRGPFGCSVPIRFPIRKSAERWLLDHVLPPDTLGGALCLETLAEETIDGERTRDFRTRGWVEAFPGLSRTLPKNAYGKSELTGDELLQPLLLAKGRLAPWQSLNVLFWFGTVKVDDVVPKSLDEMAKVTRLEPTDRAKRARLALGPVESDEGVLDVQLFLKVLFVVWVRDVDVFVDAGD